MGEPFSTDKRRFVPFTERGWSQEALADRVGIHRTYLGSVERSERNIAIDNIYRIAWALGVEPTDLLAQKRRDK